VNFLTGVKWKCEIFRSVFGEKVRNNKEWKAIKSVYLKIIVWAITVFPKLLLFTDPFWFPKIATDTHILAQVNAQCPDDRYAKLKMCISERLQITKNIKQ